MIAMRASSTHRGPGWLTVALASGSILLALALRYASLYEPRWYGDEGIFAAVATNMREGRSLYAQAWDNKPPLIFVTYAAIQSLFGTSVFALHLTATISVVATQATVMAIGAMLYGPRRGVAAGAVFALAMCTPVIEGNLALTETFMILPASLAILVFLLTERRPAEHRVFGYLLCGLLLGIAAGYKQVAVFDAAAVAVMVLLTHTRPLRALIPIAAGFLAPQVAWSAVFVASGAFPQYWYAVAGSLRLYAEMGPSEGAFTRFAGYLPALMAVAWLVRRRQLGEEVTERAFPVIWLGFAFAGAMSSSFPFPHYLQQAVPACALAVAANPLRHERDTLAKVALGVGAVLVVAVAFGQFAPEFRQRRQLNPVAYYRTFVSHRWGTMSDAEYDYKFDGKVTAVNDIVGYMKDDGAGTSLYAWSELPWLYAAGGFTNPARYYTSFLGELVPGAKPDILTDLRARPPVYVVVSDGAYAPFGELDDFISLRYVLIRAQGDWRLYRLETARGRLAPDNPLAQRR